MPLASIRPAPVNDVIYGKINPSNPEIIELANLLASGGQREPIHLTTDYVTVSGHRRCAAATRLGWTEIKAVFEDFDSTDPRFEREVVIHNQHRTKTPDVLIREQLVLADPDTAHQVLLSERAERAKVKATPIPLGDGRRRCAISPAKLPFLRAVEAIIGGLREHWPLSDRSIHYRLLNYPPLKHAGKPGSVYRNDLASYKSACELLTRARIAGLIPFEAIGDETRPVQTWAAHPNVGPFVRQEVDEFLANYWRDLMQGQPNHIEIVAEKLTVESAVRQVAMRFCIPYTIGRGYSSLPPRKAMFDRFRASGRDKLVIVFLADHDPEGVDIPEAFSKSMRDDFGVAAVVPVRAGLTRNQIDELMLPPNSDVKTTGSRFKKYVGRYGTAVYELDAAPPDTLQAWLTRAVETVIDTDAFNAQIEAEKRDAAELHAIKRLVGPALQQITANAAGVGL